MINTIENTILEKLKENFPNFKIDSFPVNFVDYYFSNPTGCILVRFENSSMSAQNTITAVNSNETYNFSIFIALRYAQKHSDGYDDLEKLKRVLNGMPIFNKRLRVIAHTFEDEINGDLYYSYKTSIDLSLIDKYEDLSEANERILNVV